VGDGEGRRDVVRRRVLVGSGDSSRYSICTKVFKKLWFCINFSANCGESYVMCSCGEELWLHM